ncbi:hypothetical protein [Streptomyces chrestomyceticus]|uniref:hypothetical protein n=1 Tax=Streptomyces chrestomyceticus TaxID=68185 RepID=UPI000F6252ED|nr:hypothetical protein [Streptomyces chrestomyceticus]
MLSKGARITAGALCLLFLLHTLYWLGHDLVTLGPGTVWGLWTGGASAGFGGAPMAAYPVATPYELGLALLQGAAVGTAFAGRRPAGGLLAVATTLTLSLRVQAVVSTGSHTSTDLWFVGGGGIDDSTLTAVFLSAGALVPLALVAAVVLPAGIRAWPRPGRAPGRPPVRPHGPAGPASAIALGALTLLWVIWICYALVQSLGSGSGASLEMLFTGHGVLRAMLGMAPGWAWLTFLPLCAVGTILAATRRVSARSFALGTALALLPVAFLALIGSLRTGTLFELGDVAPGGALLGRVQMLVELVGSVVVLVLMGRRGVPVQPGVPGFAVPGLGPVPGVPGPYVPGSMGAPAYGPFGGPMPGAPGYQAPPGHQAPPGYQAPGGFQAPAGYPPPQGGFGPPPAG